MSVLYRDHFHPDLDPRVLEELRMWAEGEAEQLESVADHLNALLPPELRFLVDGTAGAAERLRRLVGDL